MLGIVKRNFIAVVRVPTLGTRIGVSELELEFRVSEPLKRVPSVGTQP